MNELPPAAPTPVGRTLLQALLALFLIGAGTVAGGLCGLILLGPCPDQDLKAWWILMFFGPTFLGFGLGGLAAGLLMRRRG